jgi:hypothetical protein
MFVPPDEPAPPWRGEYVLVKQYRGKPARVQVWDASQTHVAVVGEENFTSLSHQKLGNYPVWFPAADVFVCDTAALELLAQHNPAEEFPWNRCQQWEQGK